MEAAKSEMSDNARNVLITTVVSFAVIAIIWIIAIYSNDYNKAKLKTQEACIQARMEWNTNDRCIFPTDK